MVGIVIVWPGLVTAFLDKPSDVDPTKIEIVIPPQEQDTSAAPGEEGKSSDEKNDSSAEDIEKQFKK